ncbi:hypothetical protein [Sphingomonas sp. R86521]
MGKLNVLSVKNAKPGRHGDGGGLHLLDGRIAKACGILLGVIRKW